MTVTKSKILDADHITTERISILRLKIYKLEMIAEFDDACADKAYAFKLGVEIDRLEDLLAASMELRAVLGLPEISTNLD